MEYSAEYLYQDLHIEDERKVLLKDLCEKIYANIPHWKIPCAYEGEKHFILIQLTTKLCISINNSDVVRFFDSSILTAKVLSWKTPADNDRVITTILTLLNWDPQYIKFMKKYNKKSKLEQLINRIQIEVDYHPDSEVVKGISDNFNSMK